MTEKLQLADHPQAAASEGKTITVAHFMPWSGIGGVEVATLRLVEATRDRFRHVAFCLPDATALIDSFRRSGIETVLYTAPTPSLRHGTTYYKESRAIAQELRRVGADIVHFSDEKAAHHNSLAASLAGCRTVCHLRVSYPHLGWRSRLCLLPVHRFIFVSQEAMQGFAMSLPDGKARVIYDAVEIPEESRENSADIRRELGIPDGSPVVGMVARVSAQKDYRTLATAAEKVLRRFPDTRFLVVGDNSNVDLNRRHYEEVLRDLNAAGIADRFIFTGHRTDVPRLISAMDFCVLSTHREGFPLSILESMAMGKAVIATSVGGIPEIVKPGVNGFLHQHENSEELANAILSLISNPKEAIRMGRIAREHVRKTYSRQIFSEEISKAYLDAMQV